MRPSRTWVSTGHRQRRFLIFVISRNVQKLDPFEFNYGCEMTGRPEPRPEPDVTQRYFARKSPLNVGLTFYEQPGEDQCFQCDRVFGYYGGAAASFPTRSSGRSTRR